MADGYVSNLIPLLREEMDEVANLKSCYEVYNEIMTMDIREIRNKKCFMGNLVNKEGSEMKYEIMVKKLNAFDTTIVDIYNKNPGLYKNGKCNCISYSLYRNKRGGVSTDKIYDYTIKTLLNILKSAKTIRSELFVIKIYLSFNVLMLNEGEYREELKTDLRIIYSILEELLRVGNVELHHVYQPNLLEDMSLESNYEIIGRQRLFRFLPMIDGTCEYVMVRDIDSILQKQDIEFLNGIIGNPYIKLEYIDFYGLQLGSFEIDYEEIYSELKRTDEKSMTYSGNNKKIVNNITKLNQRLSEDEKIETKDLVEIDSEMVVEWNIDSCSGNVYTLPPWIFSYWFLNRDFNISLIIPAGLFWLDSKILNRDFFNNVYRFVKERIERILVKIAFDKETYNLISILLNTGFDEIFLSNLFGFLTMKEREIVEQFISIPESQEVGFSSPTVNDFNGLYVPFVKHEEKRFNKIDLNTTSVLSEYSRRINSFLSEYRLLDDNTIEYFGGRKTKKTVRKSKFISKNNKKYH